MSSEDNEYDPVTRTEEEEQRYQLLRKHDYDPEVEEEEEQENKEETEEEDFSYLRMKRRHASDDEDTEEARLNKRKREILKSKSQFSRPKPSPRRRYQQHYSSESLRRTANEGNESSLPTPTNDARVLVYVPAFKDELPRPYVPGEYCFMCDCSQNRMEMVDNPRYRRLVTIVEENYDKIGALETWKLVQNAYDTDLRYDTIDAKEWPIPSIAHHFRVDNPLNIVTLVDAQRLINHAMYVIQDKMFQEDVNTGVKSVVDTSLNLYLKLMKEREAVNAKIEGKRSNAVA